MDHHNICDAKVIVCAICKRTHFFINHGVIRNLALN